MELRTPKEIFNVIESILWLEVCAREKSRLMEKRATKIASLIFICMFLIFNY
ncbi:MAG: hypothetical protein RIR55_1512 [Bacteroidota bacterium]|jgi:hypothetical protein